MMRGDPAGSEQLLAIIVYYLESTDRGDTPDIVLLLSTCPDLAAEFHAFLNTHAWLYCLTGPVREVVQASQSGFATGFAIPRTDRPTPAEQCGEEEPRLPTDEEQPVHAGPRQSP
jgi:hypothetical protein